MDLRSGHPFWLLKNGLLSIYPSLRENITCDVAVIGAGITGALTAYYLAREGVDAVVIDRRAVATGSTAASTALLQHAADTELVDLVEMVGEAAAVRSYRLGLDASRKTGSPNRRPLRVRSEEQSLPRKRQKSRAEVTVGIRSAPPPRF
jgi:glycine/D-amino acid oxidase-like deaminating enzyme